MTFITHSACKGNPPQQFSNTTHFARNALLGQMMRNREAVRYILAPFGFGKSLLACSYADLVNNFEHTFWLDGENPCFLRDLDAQTLLPDLLDTTKAGDLIVFDDIAHLGATRREKLWEICEGLVRKQREVCVCATPSADPLRGHETACVCIGAHDLLYSAKDASSLQACGVVLRQDVPALHPVGKVPGLAGCAQGSFCTFLRAHIDEMDNPAQCALSFVMLMLERGTFEDLELLLGCEITAQDIDAKRLRAFVEVDEFNGEFVALGFPLKETLTAFAPYMSAVAREAGVDDANELSAQLSDVLLERGSADRALRLVMHLCNPHGRSMWLAKNQEELLNACALAAAEGVYDSLRSERWRSKPELHAASCIRKALLNYAEGAHEDLVRVAGKVDYPLYERLKAASYAYLLTDDASVANELETLFHAQGKSLKREVENLKEEGAALWHFWSHVSTAAKLDSLCSRLIEGPAASFALACCVHKMRLAETPVKDAPKLQQRVQVLLQGQADNPHTAALALLRREADAFGLTLDMKDLGIIAAYHRCDVFEDELEVQRTIYARNKTSILTSAAASLRVQAAQARSKIWQRAKSAVPLLNVSLFGGLNASVGNISVGKDILQRQKVRTLLSLLVLEAGHDLSCDNLAARIWPDSPDIQARHNLYNVISKLRRSLTLADGSCPYLHRQHGIISLKKEYIQSDVGRMHELCQRLRFSDPDPDLCFHILEEVRSIYRGELLPAEMDEPMLIAAREDWRNRVVNSLMHAAKRLIVIGDKVVALQMAEQALAYSPQREDCYEQLMSLQAKCGQRPAAVRTWIQYRTFLKDELGLDPSQRMQDLYQRIISENK